MTCLVRIGGRKGRMRHHQAYYDASSRGIVLNWTWYQREKDVEANIVIPNNDSEKIDRQKNFA